MIKKRTYETENDYNIYEAQTPLLKLTQRLTTWGRLDPHIFVKMTQQGFTSALKVSKMVYKRLPKSTTITLAVPKDFRSQNNDFNNKVCLGLGLADCARHPNY